MSEELKQAAQAALEALEEIALAGMSGTGQESEEGLRDWHARQAWKFIGIAARELEPLRRALTQRPAEQATPKADPLNPGWCVGCNPDNCMGCGIGLNEAQATPEPVVEPFGYFRALPFGWEQCGEHDDGAVALYTRPAPGVPEDVQDLINKAKKLGNGNNPAAYREVLTDIGRAILAAAQAKGVR